MGTGHHGDGFSGGHIYYQETQNALATDVCGHDIYDPMGALRVLSCSFLPGFLTA